MRPGNASTGSLKESKADLAVAEGTAGILVSALDGGENSNVTFV
jgi:hypothetical protein